MVVKLLVLLILLCRSRRRITTWKPFRFHGTIPKVVQLLQVQYYSTVQGYAHVLVNDRRLKVQRDKLFLFIAKNFKFSFSSSPHVLLLRHTVLL